MVNFIVGANKKGYHYKNVNIEDFNHDYVSDIRNVKEGDIVFINPDRFMVKKYRDGSLKDGVIKENEVIGYNFDIIDIAGKPHMLLNENDIKFIAEEYEFYETEETELIK